MSIIYGNTEDMSQKSYDLIESEPIKHTDFFKDKQTINKYLKMEMQNKVTI